MTRKLESHSDYLLRKHGIEITSMTVCQLGSGQFEAVGELV
jgi:hypothetical protein